MHYLEILDHSKFYINSYTLCVFLTLANYCYQNYYHDLAS